MKKERKKFLTELKQFGIKNNIPNISAENGEFLHFLTKIKKAESVLEIGCANGYSTIIFADAIENMPNAKIVTIDHSKPSFAQCQENIKLQNLEKIVEMKFGSALDILPTITEKFDVIFIDAEKKMYHEFWLNIKKNMKPDTLVIVDDVLKFPTKTAKFHKVMESETEYEKTIIKNDEDDGIMLIKKL